MTTGKVGVCSLVADVGWNFNFGAVGGTGLFFGGSKWAGLLVADGGMGVRWDTSVCLVAVCGMGSALWWQQVGWMRDEFVQVGCSMWNGICTLVAAGGMTLLFGGSR